MRNATLCFLIKENKNKITDIFLAMKKRGFGKGRWNGTGGKVKSSETIEECAVRETEEETKVKITNFHKIAEIKFYFPHNQDWNQLVHIYFATQWKGVPKETEEMKPHWFKVGKIPYDKMWPDDIYWLPKALQKQLLKGKFVFGDKGQGEKIIKQTLKTVEKI